MKEYKCLSNEVSEDYPTTITYNAKVGGYQATMRLKPLRVVVPTQEEYYRYIAGERKHLFPEFDPKIHTTHAQTWQPEVNAYEEIPITLNEISREGGVSIPYGCFHLLESQSGPYLERFNISADGYIDLGRSEYTNVYKDFSTFRSERSFYESERKRHRSSALLYGPPGNGKTREICRILQNAEQDKFRAIFIGSGVKDLMLLESFREPLGDEDTVFVIEEITERTKDKNMVDQLLSFLDGELSWNHSFTIATTNYPELLELNIVDRPGRFKSIVEIPSPNYEERVMYLLGSGIKQDEAHSAAKLTDGLSIDYLNSIIFDHKRTNQSFKELLWSMKESRHKTSKRFKPTIGLSGGTGLEAPSGKSS